MEEALPILEGSEVVTLDVSEAGCLAGAMLGGVALGVWSDLKEATEALVREDRSFEPDALQHQRYQDVYAKYARAWPAIAELMHEL